jgi:tetratricopeptide (TPR) repeat protein
LKGLHLRYNAVQRYLYSRGNFIAREVTLEAAVSEIKQACDAAGIGSPPFFIIAGAGISVPYVPLASEIARDCKRIASEQGRLDEPAGKSPMEVYAHWLQKAFPDRGLRQDYFRHWILNKPISHANLRLAHLLSEKKLATLVVTPNFDNFLTRALNLFGQEHIVCDHPATTERINPESDDIQVVHVHGTHWFYDLCNLPGEIRGRTVDTPLQSVTMPSLLDDILRRHSAIVIGYSGWDGDVITTALRRRHISTVRHNLYWFCYSRSNLDSVPQCVRDSLDACIVLPPPVNALLGVSPPTMTSKIGDSSGGQEPSLPAQLVLDKLVQAFTLKSPHLTLDPIGFFADELGKSFPQDTSITPGDDIYDLRGVIRTVANIRRSAMKKKPAALESEIERVRDAVRRSAYPEALRRVARLEARVSSAKHREMLIESALAAAQGLGDNSDSELKGYDLVIRLTTTKASTKWVTRKSLATALYNKGITLGQLNRTEDAITTYNEMLRYFADASEPELREGVAKAFFNKALALAAVGKKEEAVAAYDEILVRFGNDSELEVSECVARSLVNRGVFLGELDRGDEERASYDEVMTRFGKTGEPRLQQQVAKALFNKSVALFEIPRADEAIASFDKFLQLFGGSIEPELREDVAKALVNKGLALSSLKKSEEEMATYDEVVQRFGDSEESTMLEIVAMALINKAAELARLERVDQAVGTYDELVKRFGEATDNALRTFVAKALVRKGIELKELKRIDEARAAFMEVLHRFDKVEEESLSSHTDEARRELESLQAPPSG